MATRILHVSDLHFGARDDPILERGLVALIERVDPEVVIASGDLTHHGRREEHDAAAQFLRSLGPSLLVVPGNHDVSLHNPFSRFLQPLEKYQRFITTDLQPYYAELLAFNLGLETACHEKQKIGQRWQVRYNFYHKNPKWKDNYCRLPGCNWEIHCFEH